MLNITVVAKIKIKEEFSNEVRTQLLKLHKNTHEHDKGCLQYDMHKDLTDSNTYIFVETWESEALLEEHMKKEHFLNFIKNAENKIESLDINRLEKLQL